MGLVAGLCRRAVRDDVRVYMVRVSYDQKPYRRALMETYGARCVASPSNETESGRAILAQRPDTARARWASRSPKRWRWRHAAGGHEVRAGHGAEPCAAAPDGHRPRSDASSWRWRATTRTWSSAAAAAGRTSPASRSRSSASSCAAAKKRRIVAVEPAACPSPDARQVSPTTSATRRT